MFQIILFFILMASVSQDAGLDLFPIVAQI